MIRRTLIALVLPLSATIAVQARAEPDFDAPAMAKALAGSNVSLEQGLKASQREGTPISAKYEIEDGALQLSVYTMNNDRYSEVIVEHHSGAIAKSEAIAEGRDLKAAGVQSAAMTKAKTSLAAAVAAAVKANDGYRAIAVEPKLQDGHALAQIVLMRGEEVKNVSQKLD